MNHRIKLELSLCDDVFSGQKSFEIRFNDRGYQLGDTVQFLPYDSINQKAAEHPVQSILYDITYMIQGWGLQEGYVAFAIKEKYICQK